MSTTITESLIFSKELENWRETHGLTVTALAKLLGITKQMCSEVLNNKKTFSAENLIKTKHILNIYDSMDTKTPQSQEDYAEQNAAVLARYMTGKRARLLNFQSGLGLSADQGFVPGQSGVDAEGDLFSLLNDIARIQDPVVAKAAIAELVKSMNAPKPVQKAGVNSVGATRGPVAVRGGQSGQRATWVSGQSFDSNGGILNVSDEKLLEFCERDVAKLYDERVNSTYKSPEKELKVNNAPRLNFSRGNLQDGRGLPQPRPVCRNSM